MVGPYMFLRGVDKILIWVRPWRRN